MFCIASKTEGGIWGKVGGEKFVYKSQLKKSSVLADREIA